MWICAVPYVSPNITVSVFLGVYFELCSRMHVYMQWCGLECEQSTFVSDEVSPKDDEEAEQDEDYNSHHPSNHSVVHS